MRAERSKSKENIGRGAKDGDHPTFQVDQFYPKDKEEHANIVLQDQKAAAEDNESALYEI